MQSQIENLFKEIEKETFVECANFFFMCEQRAVSWVRVSDPFTRNVNNSEFVN